MPHFYIRTVNCDFVSRDQGADYARAEDALAIGVESAVSIGADEVIGGARSAAVEVRVEGSDGKAILRSVVAVSVSPLSIAEMPDEGAEDAEGAAA